MLLSVVPYAVLTGDKRKRSSRGQKRAGKASVHHVEVISITWSGHTQTAAGLTLQPIKSMADDGHAQLYWPRPLPHSHRARSHERILKATRIREGMMSTGALDGAKMTGKRTGTTGHQPRSPSPPLTCRPVISAHPCCI